MIEQQIVNEDLVVISAAVHLYLDKEPTKTLNNQRTVTIPVFPFSRSSVIKSIQTKRKKWKWSFFPYINQKGHRDCQWSN
jgi:hypothetical protein